MKTPRLGPGRPLIYASALLFFTAGGDGAWARDLGRNVAVGAFRLEVQVQRRTVKVQRILGSKGVIDPRTELVAEFVAWDESSRAATIAVAIRNTGTIALFGPFSATLTRLATPKAVPLNPDLAPGTWTYDLGPLAPKAITPPRVWTLEVPASDVQLEVELLGGVPVRAGTGATIVAPDGSSITVPPGAMPYDALVDIEQVPVAELGAPAGNLDVLGVVEVTFEPTLLSASVEAPALPFVISIPAGSTWSARQFLVAQQVEIDPVPGRAGIAGVDDPGPTPQLMAVAAAALGGGRLGTTERPAGTSLTGVRTGGLFAFLGSLQPFGWATGLVRAGFEIRPGSVVGNNSNALVDIAGYDGRYTLFISGGDFTVTGFDPFWGWWGSSSSTIGGFGQSVDVDISLVPSALTYPARPGIRNGGFERADVTSWTTSGNVAAVTSLGTAATGFVTRPDEGDYMAQLGIGFDAPDGFAASIAQRFKVPLGVKELFVAYSIVSELPPGFPDGDRLRGVVQLPFGGTIEFLNVTLGDLAGIEAGEGGITPDRSSWRSGWRTATVDLSSLAGTSAPPTLVFTVTREAGVGGGIAAVPQTRVLIDNLRFKTLWLDTQTVIGAPHPHTQIQQQIRLANELLSQAGVNARERDWDLLDPMGGALLDVDCTPDTFCHPIEGCKLLTTNEQNLIFTLSTPAVAKDLGVYYIKGFTGLSAAGLAVGPDDYIQLKSPPRWGVLLKSSLAGDLLAHELGHMLISPEKASSSLEHHVTDPANVMKNGSPVPRTVISPAQSQRINQSNYLVP